MLRTGVVSQRLVLQVIHMKQLVAETCRCDLSPSVSRPLEVREKARNVFVMSLRLSDHKVLHNITTSSSFFARIFSLFSLVFRTSKLLEFKQFNKTIIPFALVGYETGYIASLAIYHLISNARSWNNC